MIKYYRKKGTKEATHQARIDESFINFGIIKEPSYICFYNN